MIALPNCLFTVARKEIRYYQICSDLILPKAPFRRVVRDIAVNAKENFRWQAAAMDALQVAAEQTLITLFECKITISGNEFDTNGGRRCQSYGTQESSYTDSS